MKVPGLSVTRRSGVARERVRSIARLLALCAAVLVGFALWAPWLVATAQPTPELRPVHAPTGAGRSIPIVLSLFFRTDAVGDLMSPWYSRALIVITWLIIALAALGPLLASLLWLPRGSHGRRLALAAYTVWLTVTSIVPVGLIAGILVAVNRLSRLAAGDISWGPGWGLVPLAAGLVLGWSAFFLLERDRRSADLGTSVRLTLPKRSRSRIPGAVLLSTGVVVWGIGFLAVPWATVNCAVVPLSLNHFVEGACAGLDAGDALSALVASHVEPTGWDWYNGIYAIYGLLLGGGVLALVVNCRRTLALATRFWLAAWLLVASIVTALSYRGVAHIAAEAPVLAIQATGLWRGAPGISLAFSGLVLAWLGLLVLDGTTRDTSLPSSASQREATALLLSRDASPLRP